MKKTMKFPPKLAATGVAMSLVLMTTTMNGGVVHARRNNNSSNENRPRYPPRQPSTISSLEVNYGYAGAWGLPVLDYSVNDPHPDPCSDQEGNDTDSRNTAIAHARRAPATHQKSTSDAKSNNDHPHNFIQQVAASRRIQQKPQAASHDDHVSKNNRGTRNMEKTTAPLSRTEQVFFDWGISQHHSFSEYLEMSDGLE